MSPCICNVVQIFLRVICRRAKVTTVQKCPLVLEWPFRAKVSPRAKVTLRAEESPWKSVPSCKTDAVQKFHLMLKWRSCKNDAVQKWPLVQKWRRAKVRLVQKCQLVQKCLRAKVTRSRIYDMSFHRVMYFRLFFQLDFLVKVVCLMLCFQYSCCSCVVFSFIVNTPFLFWDSVSLY